jgi:hypothetical protein
MNRLVTLTYLTWRVFLMNHFGLESLCPRINLNKIKIK